MTARYAYMGTDRELAQVRQYLPANYTARRVASLVDHGILISGQDEAGWTLDGYVIPRLASGLHYAREISAAERDVILAEAQAADEIEWAGVRGISDPDF